MRPPLLRVYNTVVYFYRFCLTPLLFFTRLWSNAARWMRRLVQCGAGFRWSVACMAVVVSGCAGFASKPPEESVKERAQARANAVVQGDYKTAYGYFSPTARKLMSYEAYVQRIVPGFWKSATLDKVECKHEDQCDASFYIEYEHSGMRVRTPYRESWIREGNEWWYGVRD